MQTNERPNEISRFEDVLIFSTHLPVELREYLTANNVLFKELEGKFEGKLESSFMVRVSDIDLISYLKHNYFLDQQKSCLHLSGQEHFKDGKRYATLFECFLRDRSVVFLHSIIHDGYWIELPPYKAASAENWTYDPVANKYWVIESSQASMAFDELIDSVWAKPDEIEPCDNPPQ